MSSTQTDLNAAAVLLAGQRQPPWYKVGVPVISGGTLFNPVVRFVNGQVDKPFSPLIGITNKPDGAHITTQTANSDGSLSITDHNVSMNTSMETGHITAEEVQAAKDTDHMPSNKTNGEKNNEHSNSYIVYYIGAALVLAGGVYFLIKLT